jgi:hypothetical protein
VSEINSAIAAFGRDIIDHTTAVDETEFGWCAYSADGVPTRAISLQNHRAGLTVPHKTVAPTQPTPEYAPQTKLPRFSGVEVDGKTYYLYKRTG